jgi:hypothetical protein
MPSAPPPVSIEIGDIVGLIGKPPRFIIREIRPDGKHAVCERAFFVGSGAFVAVPSSSYSSYVLALADLEKPRAPGSSAPASRVRP